MKINPMNDAALAAATAAASGAAVRNDRGAAAPAAAAKVQDASSGVPVTMSAAARSLEKSTAGSGIDEAKVAAMRAAISNGTFTVNAGNIADKLLSNAQEFLSRARS